MNNVINLKGGRSAPKSQSSRMETMIVSIDQVRQWRVPPFQRPIRINAKVMSIAEQLKRGEVMISGIVTLGKIARDPTHYIVDGQHRLEAFRISELAEIIVDLRIIEFDDMAEMAEEFVRLNSALVRMRPDDILRGLEPTSTVLGTIKKECPFVGYDQVRRGNANAILSMSAVLRCWAGSAGETPTATAGAGISASQVAAQMDADSTQQLVRFLKCAFEAWGRHPEYYRLWSNLNLCLTMWLWRQLVLDTQRGGNKRIVVLTEAQFRKCLTALTASANYLDWLIGRNMTERDRSPAYAKIKELFVSRLSTETTRKVQLPQPSWASR